MTELVFPVREAGQIVALFASKGPQTDGTPLPVDDPEIVAYMKWGSSPLADVVAGYEARIDADAEAQRLRYLTPGAGQALTYDEKRSEATRILDDPSPDPANYPMLSASVGIDGETIEDVATSVRAATALWLTVAAAIEQARLAGKKAVREATTREGAEAAFLAVSWPNT